jgi:hypothetical protein
MGSDLAEFFGKAFQRPKGQPSAWHVDRRQGDHWTEVGRFQTKRLAKLGAAEAIARGEPTDELRIRKGSG